MSARRFTKFGLMILFTCPTTHILYILIALYSFSMHDGFLVYEGIIKYANASVTNTKMSSLDLSFLLESQTKSL